MKDSDTEWQIGETMAEVFRERLVELETLEAAGEAPDDIELMHRIRKGQFKLGKLCIKDNRATEIWNAVLAA